jgi:hypothetical protein
MTRAALTQRIGRLEDAAGGTIPLYMRRWLGEPLTADEQVQADAEWQHAQASAPSDLSRLTPAMREWLAERPAPA